MECCAIRPRPACANCRSFEWDTVVASGRGTVYSYVVNHYPQVPAFDYPLVVALIELEEGTRLVANVAGIEPEEMAIGMPVQVDLRGVRRRADLAGLHQAPTGVPKSRAPTAPQPKVPRRGEGTVR